MLTVMFMGWTGFAVWRSGHRAYAADFRFTLREKLVLLPKVLPFLAIIVLVMWALYGGAATPSEAAGLGALFCVGLAVVIYRMWRAEDLWRMLRDALRELVMILLIIATAIVFGYMLASLYITQSLAEWIAALDVNRWVVMAAINVLLLFAGCFLPPAAIILMTAPILLPIILAAGFDPVWFGVVLTINMEVGLITPPVGLNLYVISAIAPDVSLEKVLRGSVPYVLCILAAIVILCVVPEIATALPDALMGKAH